MIVYGCHFHHYTSHQFCSLWCWGGSQINHLFTQFASWRSKTPEWANELNTKCLPHHLVASSTIYIASWARPSCQLVVFPRGPSPPFSVKTQPRVALPGYEQFWRIPITTWHHFCALAIIEKIEGWRTKYKTGFDWENWGEAAIMTQNQSCCRAPHKNYSRRNGTWPRGKSAPPSAGLALAQSGHSLVWCPPPIRLVCSLLSHSKVI